MLSLCNLEPEILSHSQTIISSEAVFVIKRLILHEFALENLVREGPYYKDFFLKKISENFVGT